MLNEKYCSYSCAGQIESCRYNPLLLISNRLHKGSGLIMSALLQTHFYKIKLFTMQKSLYA